MKRIGIVTFFENYNYGSSLQAFALKNYLIEAGFDAFIVNYSDMRNELNNQMHKKTYFNRMKCSLCHPSVIPEMLKGKKTANKSLLRKKEIVEAYDRFTGEHLSPELLDLCGVDTLICGSDQVWKLQMPGLHEVFFLRYPGDFRRISYAASIGCKEVPKYNERRLKKYLCDFDAISVREDDARQLLEKELGLDIEQVLDPVLLVGTEFWKSKIIQSKAIVKENEPFILCYFLDDYSKYADFIIQNGTSQNAKIIMMDTDIDVPAQLKNKVKLIAPDPLTFVKYIYDSKMVITDSFHGTAFSLLFNKIFWTMPRNYSVYSGQNSRLESILRMTGFEERFYNGKNSEFDLFKYGNCNDELAKHRVRSQMFLKRAIEG